MNGSRPESLTSEGSASDVSQSAPTDRTSSGLRAKYADTARIVELEAEVDGLRAALNSALAQADQHALLMAEMNHRVRNTFAVVQAMVHSTRRNAPTEADFRTAFDNRLMVMARSHDLLMRTEWSPTDLGEVIQNAAQPFDLGPSRFTLEGPPVMLGSNHVVAVSLTIHELATNAVKHGSLSAGDGRVTVTWTSGGEIGGIPQVQVLWLERGGPLVETPTRRGFGSQLLAIGMPGDGKVRVLFSPEGLECRILLPCAIDK